MRFDLHWMLMAPPKKKDASTGMWDLEFPHWKKVNISAFKARPCKCHVNQTLADNFCYTDFETKYVAFSACVSYEHGLGFREATVLPSFNWAPCCLQKPKQNRWMFAIKSFAPTGLAIKAKQVPRKYPVACRSMSHDKVRFADSTSLESICFFCPWCHRVSTGTWLVTMHQILHVHNHSRI